MGCYTRFIEHPSGVLLVGRWKMKKLYIVEKSYIYHQLKQLGLVDVQSDCVVTNGLGFWRYKTKKINQSQVPFTDQPKAWSIISCEPIYIQFPYTNILTENISVESFSQKLKLRWNDYNEIIVIVSGQFGCWSANQIIKRMPAHDYVCVVFAENKYPTAELLSNSVNQKTTWRDNRRVAEQIAIANRKYFFDFWWNTNSMAVFGDIFAHVGLDGQKVCSKFELMALLAISKEKDPVSLDYMVSKLVHWGGSGKYFPLNEIGSIGSWTKEINKLMWRGILTIDSIQNLLVMTAKGTLLLSYIHKQTYDPDLPFRLEKWCQDNEISQMKQYIRQVFGRQLRFQKKLKTETKE